MTLLLTILAFGLMVFVHELGHFWMARRCGVGVEKFSIGFGQPIREWKKNGVLWRIGWIPLGGYVKMKGENPDEPDSADGLSFRSKPWWKKVLIGLSGPFANLLLGLLLFVVSFLLPVRMEDQRPVVHSAEGKWASVFAPGDSLVSFNGKPVKGFTDFLEALLTQHGGMINLNRAGQMVNLHIAASDADSLALSLLPQVGTIIGEVIPKTPAYHAKLLEGDRIVAVDSTAVRDWYAMREIITNSQRDSVELTIARGNTTFTKNLRLESNLATGTQRAIGIMQDQPLKYKRIFKPWEAARLGAFNTVNFIRLNYQMLWKLAKKPAELKKSVGGPVMIATMSQQIARKGAGNLLLFFGSISLMLMIMNLLPIPVLDGGLILFSIIEGIFRRPIPQQIRSILQSIGFFILLALMVLAFYSDITSEILRFMNR